MMRDSHSDWSYPDRMCYSCMLYIQSFIRSYLWYWSLCGGCGSYAETLI